MQELKLFIPYDFPNWNEYIKAERTNKFKASQIKKRDKEAVVWMIKEQYKYSYPITLTIRPHFKHKKKDLDNYRMKGLIDGLVSAGVIENDNLTKINKIILEPVFSDTEGVEVIIKPTNQLESFVDSLTEEERKRLTELVKNKNFQNILTNYVNGV